MKLQHEGRVPMPLRMMFSVPEREKLGVLVNNFCVYGTQLMTRGGSQILMRALTNLTNFQKDNEDFLKRLNELAREQNEESPLRLIEDLGRVPTDVGEMLTVIRRCLFASAFVGHLLAQPTHAHAEIETQSKERQLH